ncbi:hypothetical protein ACF0H5_015316 [Mactra antiquata]
MDVKVCLVVILLSVIATDNVFAAVSGTACTANGTECVGITNAVCDTALTKPVCKCKDGYTEESDSKCQPDLNSPCIDGDTCTTNNAACVGDTGSKLCKCSSGFKDDGSGGCIPDKALNETCTAKAECPTNAVCQTTCQCDSGYKQDGDKCVLKVVSDLDCTDADASKCPDNAVCENNKCQCGIGYVEEGKQCASAASTKAMHWMIFASLLILLVDKLPM